MGISTPLLIPTWAQAPPRHAAFPSEPREEAPDLVRFSFSEPAGGTLLLLILTDSFRNWVFTELIFFIFRLPSGLLKFPFCWLMSWSCSGFKQIFPNTFSDLITNRWRHPFCFLNRNELDTQLNLDQYKYGRNYYMPDTLWLGDSVC